MPMFISLRKLVPYLEEKYGIKTTYHSLRLWILKFGLDKYAREINFDGKTYRFFSDKDIENLVKDLKALYKAGQIKFRVPIE